MARSEGEEVSNTKTEANPVWWAKCNRCRAVISLFERFEEQFLCDIKPTLEADHQEITVFRFSL